MSVTMEESVMVTDELGEKLEPGVKVATVFC
jgi:hypothetical protein